MVRAGLKATYDAHKDDESDGVHNLSYSDEIYKEIEKQWKPKVYARERLSKDIKSIQYEGVDDQEDEGSDLE